MRLDFSRRVKGGVMRAATLIMRGLAWMIIAMLVIPPGIPAQDIEQPEQTDRFKKEELDQMVAPIALYPDSLIAHILMASTYPLEVVQAERPAEDAPLRGDPRDLRLGQRKALRVEESVPDGVHAFAHDADG